MFFGLLAVGAFGKFKVFLVSFGAVWRWLVRGFRFGSRSFVVVLVVFGRLGL